MHHSFHEKVIRFHGDREVVIWRFSLNLQNQEDMLHFLEWAFATYGMERQYENLFEIGVSYDNVTAEPAVQYHILTHLDDNQAMRWKLKWGSGRE